MTFSRSSIAFAAMLAASTVMSAPVQAQDASPEHLKAARAAIKTTHSTDAFDNLLLIASVELKKRLAANNPDRANDIDRVVDEEALALAPRRGDLEKTATDMFMANFTKEELDSIATFFGSEVGKKYLRTAPIVGRELAKAARIWHTGIQRDLSQNATKRLNN